MALERHHILFNKRAWTSYREAETLREERSLIVPLEHDAHKELHKNVPIVPLLGYYGLVAVRNNFEAGSDPLESIDNLQLVIEKAKKHPRAHSIEKSLAELAIEALELQKQFIEI